MKSPKLHLVNLICRGMQAYTDISRGNYRQQFYLAIDIFIFSVRDHFDQPSFLESEQLEALLLKALKGKDTSSMLEFVRKKYGDEVNVK